MTLVESRAFPRLKVCGEFISPAATPTLESLLTPEQLLGLGARRVSHLVLESVRGSVEWAMPQAAWVLSRSTLDTALVNEAQRAGVGVRQPCTVRSVECDEHGVTATIDEGQTISADIVVHADGHGRLAGPGARPTPSRPGVLGHKCHLRLPSGAALRGLHMRGGAGGYVGLVEVEHGLVTVALVARAALTARFKGDADALLTFLWPQYDAAWRQTSWLSCGVAGAGYADTSHPRAFRAGNAAAAVEPVGGEGIGLALWSGAILSDALQQAVPSGSGVSPAALVAAHRLLASAYSARVRWRRPACRLAAECLMRPWLTGALWPVLSIGPARGALLAPWYALTGKPFRKLRPAPAVRCST